MKKSLPLVFLIWLFGGTAFAQLNYEPYEVRTVPLTNGDPIGSHAQLIPGDIAVSPSGDLIVLETQVSCVRKIAPNGAVTIFAGIRNTLGMRDGPGKNALFAGPVSLAIDAAGIIYLADNYNSTIRKVTTDGTVTTLAGGPGPTGPGNTGSADGTGRDARFNFPRGITISSAGLIYVADTNNATIRTITPQGLVTTLAGSVGVRQSVDGPVSSARFVAPGRMAADGSGNVYVLDAYTVRKITADGKVTTLAGKAGELGFVDGLGQQARFSSFAGITATPNGTLFVMDNERVRMITPAGQVTTLAGGYPGQYPGDIYPFDGQGLMARFKNSQGLTIDPSGTLYVVDEKIRRVMPDFMVTTLPVATLFGSFEDPDDIGAVRSAGGSTDVAVDARGYIYLTDTSGCIRKISPDGVITTLRAMTFLRPESWLEDMTPRPDGRKVYVSINPSTLAVDSSGEIYFNQGTGILRMDPDGRASVVAGDPLFAGHVDGIGRQARFNVPRKMVFDGQNNLYFTDTSNYTIRKMIPGAVVTTVAGSPGVAGNADGAGSSARFAYPTGIAVDTAGNIYVADNRYIAVSETIRKITPDGTVTTFAGLAGVDGMIDGIGTAARFHHPTAVGVDSRGNVYVADAWNRLLRKITPNATVTTLAGTSASSFGADGIGSAASFDTGMTGVAPDSIGNLYLIDSNRLRIATSTLKVRSLNVSTRLQVLDGENVLIGGFIVGGSSQKKVIIRALGPSLAANSITGALPDPTLELYDSTGSLLSSNDNWKVDSKTLQSQQALIEATTIPPTDDREAAIVATLDPQKAYTVVVRGSHGEKGISIVEVYDMNSSAPASLANISTRGFVEPGEKVMIAGFILGGNNGNGEMLLRALGPSLAQSGIANPLANPTLALFNANGQLIAYNDDWAAGDAAKIQAAGLQPPSSLEAAISIVLPAGAYTAVVGGYGESGVALVEAYNLP